jgi:hypothetical protein
MAEKANEDGTAAAWAGTTALLMLGMLVAAVALVVGAITRAVTNVPSYGPTPGVLSAEMSR